MIFQTSDSVTQAADAARQEIIRKLDDINFFYIGLVVVLALFTIWVVRKVVPWVAQFVPTRFRLSVLGIVPIVRLLVLLLATSLILSQIVIFNRNNLIVIGGALGVALGFGFKDLISSIIAGVVAVFEKPYRPGDWVSVGDDYGEITDVGLRAFRMVTPSDDVVTVTHDRIWTENVSNSNDGSDTLMCVADFFVAPDHDAETLRRGLREVALTSPFLSYAKPVMVILSETPWATHYKLKAYPFDMRDQFRFVSDLTVRGKTVLRNIGAREVTAPYAPQPGEG